MTGLRKCWAFVGSNLQVGTAATCTTQSSYLWHQGSLGTRERILGSIFRDVSPPNLLKSRSAVYRRRGKLLGFTSLQSVPNVIRYLRISLSNLIVLLLTARFHSFLKDAENTSSERSKEYFILFTFRVWSLWNIYAGNEILGPDRYLQRHCVSRLSGDF